jgi:hypothetical protein
MDHFGKISRTWSCISFYRKTKRYGFGFYTRSNNSPKLEPLDFTAPENFEILCGRMSGRLSPHLAGSWAAGCAYSFGCAPSATERSQPECRGVLLCARARHHRAQRGCLKIVGARNFTTHGTIVPLRALLPQ